MGQDSDNRQMVDSERHKEEMGGDLKEASKKQNDLFSYAQKLLLKNGASQNKEYFVMNTDCGKVSIHPRTHDIRGSGITLFIRFENPELAAQKYYGVNPNSGKWNHHGIKDKAEINDIVSQFVKVNESAYDRDMHKAVSKLYEAENDLEAEYIADYYGFDIDDLLEAYQTSIDEEYAEKLDNATTPGNGIREALGLDEKDDDYDDQSPVDELAYELSKKQFDTVNWPNYRKEALRILNDKKLDNEYNDHMNDIHDRLEYNRQYGEDVEEGVLTGLASVAGGVAGGMVGAATPIPGGAMIGRALGAKAASALVGAKDDVDDDASDEEQEAAISDVLDKDPQAKQKVAQAIGKMNPAQIKATMMNSQDNKADPIMEHKICEETVEIDEAQALKLIKERLKYAKTGKGLEARESFNADVKLSTPKSVVTQLTKKYGHPEGWQIAEAPEGSSYYVLSGAIPETQRAKELEKSITSLDEEITSVREKYNDVKDDYRLPQEIRVESMRKSLEEMVAGHKHQVARWLTLDEASALVTLAHKWAPKGK